MYEFDEWGAARDAWDLDTGAPGIGLFGNAVQVWAVMQNRRQVSVAEAARAFNVPPERIVEAVEEHSWMFLSGSDFDPAARFIEHEGE